jgi:uncharacterized Rossmann fold enzyme
MSHARRLLGSLRLASVSVMYRRGFAEGERARLLAAAAGAMSERVLAFKAQHLMRRVALRPCLARVTSRTGPKPILRRLPARRYTTTQLAEPRGVICK